MKMARNSMLLGALAVLAMVAECSGDDGVVPVGHGIPQQIVDVQELTCSPVGTNWPKSATGSYQLQAPQLAVVRTDLRPKDTNIFLDGRFVGRARYFNGKKGFLYLEPGEYRIEAVAEGYRTDVFLVRAQPNCRFDIKHRMIKGDKGQENRNIPAGKGEPVQWIWAPVATASPPALPAFQSAADPSLRPDLTVAPPRSTSSRAGNATLRMNVRPSAASVYLDGEFLATARQLELMVSPLAVTDGNHRIEVLAPGYVGQVLEVTLLEGEEKSVGIVLVAVPN